MTRRLFTACLGTETNTFSPIPTGLNLFAATMLVENGQHGATPNLFGAPLIAWRERARALGWDVREGLAAFATPAGTTTRAAHEHLRDRILADLERAMPVDAVLLNLHGAMIADGYPDAEGDLVARVRARVGPDVFVGVELDLHCHLTELKVASADAIVIYKEYPHVDVVPRAHELFDLCRRTLDGEIRPVMAMHDCRVLGIFPTTREPMLSIVADMQAMEKRPGMLSVSLAHGFPWGDTPECGTRTLAVADRDAALARAAADALGARVWREREAMLPPFMTIDQAIDRIVQAAPGDKPFVLADMADNTGIGAAGDSTFLIARMLERGVGGVAVSTFWDPIAVSLAKDAGVGARLPMRIGGKLGPSSGAPLDVTVTVMALVDKAWQKFAGLDVPLGDVAWVRIGDDDASAIDIVLNTTRVQSFDPTCFSSAGIDPLKPRALVVKSTQHFFAGFVPVAREVLYVSAPGAGSMDMKALPHQVLKAPRWPKVADPHAAG